MFGGLVTTWEFPKLWVNLGSPETKDHSICGSILGSPIYGDPIQDFMCPVPDPSQIAKCSPVQGALIILLAICYLI